MSIPGLEDFPPALQIAMVATVTWATVIVVLCFPIIRSWMRRLEARQAAKVPGDMSARLARIESAVESIAIEVERISENQRYLTKLQTEQPALPTRDSAIEPRR